MIYYQCDPIMTITNKFSNRKLYLCSVFVIIMLTIFITAGIIPNNAYLNGKSDSFIQGGVLSYQYGGSETDVAYSIVASADGGYALAGSTESYGNGQEDVYLVKLDTAGGMKWNKTYGGVSSEITYSIVTTKDGGYALAGYTYSYGTGFQSMWLIKTNANGHTEWTQTYGGDGWEKAHSVIATTDGGYILAGSTTPVVSSSKCAMWLVKVDTVGKMEWNQTFGGEDESTAYDIITTTDGGYALAGSTGSAYNGTLDMILVKTKATGKLECSRTYGREQNDEARALIATTDGGYAITGYTTDTSNDSFEDMWLVKTNASGHTEWNRTYGGQGIDRVNSIIPTPDGGYVLIGTAQLYPIYYQDMCLVKTNITGHMEWNQTFGGIEDDEAFSGLITNDGGIILAGVYDTHSLIDSAEVWFIKTNVKEHYKYVISTPGFEILAIFCALLTVTIVSNKRKKK